MTSLHSFCDHTVSRLMMITFPLSVHLSATLMFWPFDQVILVFSPSLKFLGFLEYYWELCFLQSDARLPKLKFLLEDLEM